MKYNTHLRQVMPQTREEAERNLKVIFGISRFYDEQWEAIDKILRGERILLIERTGFGKSLCYQYPATQFPGVTIIFSPLIALMRDQVKHLNEKRIPAAYINCEQTQEENQQSIQKAIDNKIKILYIAPERQENQLWIEATKQMKISMIVIDEAHTISTWGHDFRPAFRKIINLVQSLPNYLPVLATTATATKRVQLDIEEQIGGQLSTLRGSLIRQNFRLYVIRVHTEDEKMIWIAKHIQEFEGTGLIYTGTRINTEIYAKWLQYVGISSIDYNAGYDADTRKTIEQGLIDNKWKCVVSTNALGMGIDKSDIRFIIHTQIPASPIHYYQEIGRAGRDGKPTNIILFYNETINTNGVSEDYQLPLSFINGGRPTTQKYQKVINLLREEALSEREIMKKANLSQTQVRVIKADLIEQGIIKEVLYNKTKKYEYQYKAPKLNTQQFEELRKAKLKDLDAMVEYVYTGLPRMKFLCNFLDSDEDKVYSNCDNTNLPTISVQIDKILEDKLEAFRETYFPKLELAEPTIKPRYKYKIIIPIPNQINVFRDGTLYKAFSNKLNINEFPTEEQEIVSEIWEKHKQKASRLTDGYAASYYGVSNIGTALHHSKYENGGDFPDFLLKKALSLFGKKYKDIHFDLVMYVPPTKSGNLVRNFAIKFASTIKVPISHDLIKIRNTQEQKVFQNSYSKQDNVKDAFDIDNVNITNKTILLIDDIYDSGATLREIGKVLTEHGAKWIVPIVIAKTVGGTI